MKTIEDQIKDLENTRAAKVARNQKLAQLAANEGRSMAEDEQEEFDTNADEIDAVDEELVRRRRLQQQLGTAKAVGRRAATDPAAASRARDPVGAREPAIEIAEEKLDKGIRLARVARCMCLSRLEMRPPDEIAKRLYAERDPLTAQIVKDTVDAGTTHPENWAGALVGAETSAFADFVEFLRPQTILGKFGNDGVPSLNEVPFRTPLVSETGGGDGFWVGEAKPKPLTHFDYARTTLEPLKAANIVVLSKELIRDSSPKADVAIRNAMAKALRARLDLDFIDPAKIAGTPASSPASITNGVAAISSSGVTADHVRADLQALLSAFIAANNDPMSGVLIMRSTTALALSLMVNAMGTAEFPGVTMRGGSLNGIPMIVSQHVPQTSSGAYVVLLNASDIWYADDGDISIDMSTEASLEMSDTPTQDQPAGVSGASLVSLWQNNLVGFLAERTVNWKKRLPSAVGLLDEVNWGAIGS